MAEYGSDIYVPHQYGGYGGGGAGTHYYNALSGVGQDIAKAMNHYHQIHVQYNQASQLADALSRLGVNAQGQIQPVVTDEKGKPVDKSVRPIIDPSALQMFQAGNQSQREQMTGALNALNRLGTQQVQKAMAQAISDAGTAGQLRKARTAYTNIGTQQRQIAVGKALGLIPDIPKPPTGNQILQQQQNQIKGIAKQQKDIADRLTTAKIGGQQGIDPSVLLDDNNIVYGNFPHTLGHPFAGQFVPATDQTPDSQITHARIVGGADDGSDLDVPMKQFDRLRGMAEQWQELGNKSSAIQQQQQNFNQAWGSLTPVQQQMAIAKLNNPTQFLSPVQLKQLQQQGITPQEFMKTMFDSKFGGTGASDLVNQATTANPQPTPTPQPQDTTLPDDNDTSGENDTDTQNAQPPTDDSGDTGE